MYFFKCVMVFVFSFALLACGQSVPGQSAGDTGSNRPVSAEADDSDPRPALSNPYTLEEKEALKAWYRRHPEALYEDYYFCKHKVRSASEDKPYCKFAMAEKSSIHGFKRIPEDYPDRRFPSDLDDRMKSAKR